MSLEAKRRKKKGNGFKSLINRIQIEPMQGKLFLNIYLIVGFHFLEFRPGWKLEIAKGLCIVDALIAELHWPPHTQRTVFLMDENYNHFKEVYF